MSNEELVAAMTAAGHFPFIREWEDGPGVETAIRRDADGRLRAPLIQAFKDRSGRWVLTVFGDFYYHVPNVSDVPSAALELLRAMSSCMEFSPTVIEKYNLIELDPSEFETGDE